MKPLVTLVMTGLLLGSVIGKESFFAKRYAGKELFHGLRSQKNGYASARSVGGTASISGVIMENDSTPLSSGYISVIDEYGYEHADIYMSGYNSEGKPEEKGRFFIEGLYPGNYTLRTRYKTFLGNTTDIENATWVTLAAGEKAIVDTITVVNSYKEKPQYRVMLMGRAFWGADTTKPVVAGYINIILSPKDDNFYSYGKISLSTQTDSLGNFSRSVRVFEKEFYATVSADEGQKKSVTQWWDGNQLFGEAPSFSVADTLKNLSLHFEEGGALKVTPILEEGVSPHVYVEVVSKSGWKLAEIPLFRNTPSRAWGGIPAGEYYLKRRFGGEYYYPQTRTLEDAELVSITKGGITEVNFVVEQEQVEEKGFGTVVGTVVDADGSPFEGGELYTTEYIRPSQSRTSVKAGKEFLVGARARNDMYRADGWYGGTFQKDAKVCGPLRESDTLHLSEPIKLNLAGSVVGSLKGADGGKPLFINREYELVTYYISYENSAVSGGTDNWYKEYISDKYRVGSLPAGEYKASFFPIYFGYGSSLLTSEGYGAVTLDDSIVITNQQTVTQDFSLPKASAMIKTTFGVSLDADINEEMFLICYKPDGTIVSFNCTGFNDDLYFERKPLNKFYDRDWTIYSHDKGNPVKAYTISGVLPFLATGDYYLAAYYWDEFDGEAYRKWYGISEKFQAMGDYFLPQKIPAGAKKITITSDGQVVDGITFGKTSITSQKGRESKSVVKQISAQQNKIDLQYNLKQNAELHLFSLNGRVVEKTTLDKGVGTFSWNFSRSLGNGVYLMQMKSGNQMDSQKIIIAQ